MNDIYCNADEGVSSSPTQVFVKDYLGDGIEVEASAAGEYVYLWTWRANRENRLGFPELIGSVTVTWDQLNEYIVELSQLAERHGR